MKTKDVNGFAEEIAKLLPRIIRWFHLNRAHAIISQQINPAQFFVLEIICDNGAQKMSDLAGELRVSLPAITRMVDKLYALGLVERIPGIKDRRIISITIMPKGKRIVKKFQEQRKQALIEVFASLSEKDRRDYLRILRKMDEVACKKKDK